MSESLLLSEVSTLGMVSKLCLALNQAEINYCHWKSNEALDRSATGENDLDLLVSRSDALHFTEILCRLGFKPAQAPNHDELPGVQNFYGYDVDADRIVHVHSHNQLIFGHDRTKNFHLPIEEAYLASATQGQLFRVPSPEYEFVIFVLRMIVKYSAWESLFSGEGKLPKSARREFDYLEKRVDRAEIYIILAEHIPYVDAALFDACINALRPGASIFYRLSIGHQLQKRLQANTLRPRGTDVLLKLGRRAMRGLRRRSAQGLPGARMARSGTMIAIVGGDGAGKTTAIGNLYSWLDSDFDVRRVHMGRPPWSATTRLVRAGLKGGRMMRDLITRQGDSPDANAADSFSHLMWQVCAARDRYWTYIKARRFASNSGIVICDRFPLSQIKLMDGPQVARLVNPASTSRLTRMLVWLETRWYRAIRLPDLLIVLRVNPEIAVARKTDEEPTSVRTRSTEVWEVDWQDTSAHVIDASQPAADVLAEMKSLVWAEL